MTDERNLKQASADGSNRQVLGGPLPSLALVLCVFFATLLLLGLRARATGEAHMLASDKAFDAGHEERSLRRARAAARWYYPGAAHVTAAYDRMRAIALGAEGSGDRALALLAWRNLRGATTETRHLGDAASNTTRRNATDNVVRLLAASTQHPLSQSRRDALRSTFEGVWARGSRRAALVALGFLGMLLGLILLVTRSTNPGEESTWRGLMTLRAGLLRGGSCVLLLVGGAAWLLASLVK